MGELFNLAIFPPLLKQFVITIALSFIVGLELHSYRRANHQDLGFGTTRTFTLIGVLGFVLYLVDDHLRAWLIGMLGLVAFLAIYYHKRASEGVYSLLSPVVGLLTYIIAAVVIRSPDWFTILVVVTVLLMLSAKPGIRRFSDAFHEAEMFTFAKFLIMAGVVLPLLPDSQISPLVTVTYYQVWVALLVVSGLSYVSYLAQTYVFKEKGLLLTGLLGGLYSSTATTIVLGRRAKEMAPTPQVTQAIILATAMMYLRLLLLLLFIGHFDAALQLTRAVSRLHGRLAGGGMAGRANAGGRQGQGGQSAAQSSAGIQDGVDFLDFIRRVCRGQFRGHQPLWKRGFTNPVIRRRPDGYRPLHSFPAGRDVPHQ